MMEAFQGKIIKKTYLAFVQGRLPMACGRIAKSLEGAPALTRYQVVEEREEFSILKVWPVTGRTNQIRIHFKGIGHPLVGESKFAFRKDYPLKSKRHCLHASRLEFTHPVTAKAIAVESALPVDMQAFLRNHPH